MAPSAQHEFADLSHHEYKGRAYPTAPGSEVQPLQRARSRTSDQQSVRKLILNDSDGAADGNEVRDMVIKWALPLSFAKAGAFGGVEIIV